MSTDEPSIDFEFLDGRDAMAAVMIKPHPDDPDAMMISIRSNLERSELADYLQLMAHEVRFSGGLPSDAADPQGPEGI